MKRVAVSYSEIARLAKIARTEGICVEITRGETTIKLYPLGAQDAEVAELDRELEEFDKIHGYI